MAKRTLSQVSVSELRAEINRRQRQLPKLQKKRQKLAAALAVIDEQIAAVSGAVGRGRGGARQRARNPMSLADTIASVMRKDKPISIKEAAEAVKRAGYVSTSSQFRNVVNLTLMRDKRFKRAGRGEYVLAK